MYVEEESSYDSVKNLLKELADRILVSEFSKIKEYLLEYNNIKSRGGVPTQKFIKYREVTDILEKIDKEYEMKEIPRVSSIIDANFKDAIDSVNISSSVFSGWTTPALSRDAGSANSSSAAASAGGVGFGFGSSSAAKFPIGGDGGEEDLPFDYRSSQQVIILVNKNKVVSGNFKNQLMSLTGGAKPEPVSSSVSSSNSSSAVVARTSSRKITKSGILRDIENLHKEDLEMKAALKALKAKAAAEEAYASINWREALNAYIPDDDDPEDEDYLLPDDEPAEDEEETDVPAPNIGTLTFSGCPAIDSEQNLYLSSEDRAHDNKVPTRSSSMVLSNQCAAHILGEGLARSPRKIADPGFFSCKLVYTSPKYNRVFLTTLEITYKMLDVYDVDKEGSLKALKTAAIYLDHAPETLPTATELNDWYTTFFSLHASTIDLQKFGITASPSTLSIALLKKNVITFTIKLTSAVDGRSITEVIDYKISNGNCTKPYYTAGNSKVANIFNKSGEYSYGNSSIGLDHNELTMIILIKLLGDFLKAYICYIMMIQAGLFNVVLFTVDTYLSTRCDLFCVPNVLKHVTFSGSGKSKLSKKRLYFKPNALGTAKIATATSAAFSDSGVSADRGGARRTRSKNRNHPHNRRRNQTGGADEPSIIEKVHNAYLQVLFAIVDDYCKGIDTFLKGANQIYTDKLAAVRNFLCSKEYRSYLENIDKKQDHYAYMKELSQWLPTQVIYNPSDMNTFFDKEVKGESNIHSIHKIFPMQDDTIEIPGLKFNNIFSEKVSEKIIATDSPTFTQILNTVVKKYNNSRAKKILEEGGVNSTNKEQFERVLDYLETTYTIVTSEDILKALINEIIPDRMTASRVYNILVVYITFHGEYILDYQFIQNFVEILNANGGEFPGGFDAMKELVEDREVKDVKSSRNSAATYEVEEDPEVQQYREQLAAGSHLTPMITVGGRRTRRRKANKVKVKGSRRNRLTKKERNW